MTLGNSETMVMQSQVSTGSKRGSGSVEEEEEKVGVVSERNNVHPETQQNDHFSGLFLSSQQHWVENGLKHSVEMGNK